MSRTLLTLWLALLPSVVLAVQKGVDAPKAAGAAGKAAQTSPGLLLPAAAAVAQPAVQGAVSAVAEVAAVRERLEAQLKGMEAELGGSDPIFDHVRQEGRRALDAVEARMRAGETDPSLPLRTHDAQPQAAAAARPVRVGVYPVAADPFQWAHLLIGLRALAEFRLDKVVYVLAGDDPRKPNMTKAAQRHPMGRAVLDVFAPFFEYSPIAVGTTYDGETNIFRMLALNADRAVEAVYLVGGDHYKLKDKNGNDDTLPKIEKKLASGTAGDVPGLHTVKVGFVSRGDEGETVPTTLDVKFLAHVPFEASSTLVRGGKLALMPFAAFDWVRRHAPGLYGIGAPKP